MITTPRLTLAALALAAVLAPLAGGLVVGRLEARLVADTRAALAELPAAGWAEVQGDGLILRMSGTAPDEAARFRALAVAAAAAGPARLIDLVEVAPARPVDAPEFSLELLRGEGGLSIIGLVPGGPGAREALVAQIGAQAEGLGVTDMLETADHPAPAGWEPARDFAIRALGLLPQARVSVVAGRVKVVALAPSPAARHEAESALRRAQPAGVEVVLEISAPLVPIAPFLLRFTLGPEGAALEPCAADTPEAAARILAAAEAAGMAPGGTCRVGLGAPSADWAAAAEAGIGALGELGAGVLAINGPDITLRAGAGLDPAVLGRVSGELEARLPPSFSLRLEEGAGESTASGPVEFLASRAADGRVQLRGPVPDAALRAAVLALARAQFATGEPEATLRLQADLPGGWPLRVMAGIEALSMVQSGSLTLTPVALRLSGIVADAGQRDAVLSLLADTLGAEGFEAQLRLAPPPPPDEVASAPEPAECLRQIEAILADSKIVFAPGSTRIEGEAIGIVGEIARVLRRCPEARLEIGGHTDSQGREEMNLDLSRKRAEAVLEALRARRILVGNITARGYGESTPIADNGTEEGREANRRIEFRLVTPEPEGAAPEASGTPPVPAADGASSPKEAPDGSD